MVDEARVERLESALRTVVLVLDEVSAYVEAVLDAQRRGDTVVVSLDEWRRQRRARGV